MCLYCAIDTQFNILSLKKEGFIERVFSNYFIPSMLKWHWFLIAARPYGWWLTL
jgi:hypothetical protein